MLTYPRSVHDARRPSQAGLALALALLLALFGRAAVAAPSAVISVDGTVCTLADAITAAATDTATGGCSAGSDVDTLLLTQDINAEGPQTISGATFTIDGQGFSITQNLSGAIFMIMDADITLRNITLTGGNNTGDGGALYAGTSTVRIENSTIAGNSAANGGALAADNSTIYISNSTLANNQSDGDGGAIHLMQSNLDMRNSTLAGNSAVGDGGLLVGANSIALIGFSTISGNSAGTAGGLSVGGTAAADVFATALAGNPGGDCAVSGTLNDLGYNLVQDASCMVGSSLAVDPQLGVLGDNGGPTQTRLPAVSSPLLDAIPVGARAVLPATRAARALGCGASVVSDQRGAPRPENGACDIGAVEGSTALAVELAAFDADAQPDRSVRVTWQTAGEIDNAGFNVLRSQAADGADSVTLNGALIAALGSNGLGADYQYVDLAVAEGTWYYWLEAIDTQGGRTLHGPAIATVAQPSAVTLNGITASGAPLGLLALAALLAVASLSATFALTRRR